MPDCLASCFTHERKQAKAHSHAEVSGGNRRGPLIRHWHWGGAWTQIVPSSRFPLIDGSADAC